MREPSPRASRLALTTSIVVALGLFGTGFIAGRTTAPPPKVPIAEPTPSQPAVPDPAPVVSAALDRADLLAVAAQAGDAFASNNPMPAAVTAAAGRRFDLILPFGCEAPGALESSGAMRWSFDPKTATLRVTVDPVLWDAAQWSAVNDAGGKAALRGFWIAKPWSSATTCAAFRERNTAVGDTLLVPPAPTLAIARPTGPGDGGRIRPYEVVQRASADDFAPERGFQLRIIGRTSSPTEGGPVRCLQTGGHDQRPICFIIGTFFEVRIENPKSRAVLASWLIGDDVRDDENTDTDTIRARDR